MSIDDELKSQLIQYLQLIENPIKIVLSIDESQDSLELGEFIHEVVTLSEKIQLKYKSLELTPSFQINREDEETGIVFAGVPLGHEFESFVLALLQVGGRPPKIDEEAKKRIQAIDQDLKFETIVSLSCHNCPDVVQALNIMSVLNPKISHTMIEGGTFQDIADERGVMAVPSVFLNGQELIGGRTSLEQILDMVSGPQDKMDFEDIEPFDVLVVGGGPAAASAALYAARKGVRTGLVSDEFGGQVKETLGIENILGLPYTEGPKFMDAVNSHIKEYGVEFINGLRVENLVSDNGLKLHLNNGAILESKTVVVATGARWKLLGIPGEKELRNKGVAYCTHCDGPLFKGKTVAVIGGGNSGVEAAIDLAAMVKEVILLEYLPELKADDVLQERLKALPNVRVETNVETTAITGHDRVNGITYKDREHGYSTNEIIEGCFIQIGLVPNTDWLKNILDLNKNGEIIVDKAGATNLEGVFAAGDCTDTVFKQIVIAAGEGATAALSAYNYIIRQSLK